MPGPFKSIYADIYVKGSKRALKLPRVSQYFRHRKLAKAGPVAAFYRNRFYEIDRWYKARIEKPVIYPECHTIDPDDFSKSLKERLEDLNRPDPLLNQPVNIGLPYTVKRPSVDQFRKHRDSRQKLENPSRTGNLKIDLAAVAAESAISTWPQQVCRLAKHFGIFQDLFHPDAYFYPVVPMRLEFYSAQLEENDDDDRVSLVFWGNHLKPYEVQTQPRLLVQTAPHKSSEPQSLWTLLMTNPDGNPYENDKEVLHWLVTDLETEQLQGFQEPADGQTLCPYLQPIPFRGTGHHRFCFILFKQIGSEKLADKLNFDGIWERNNLENLEDRTFSTSRFYKINEDLLTPAGLSWFQADWDPTCQDVMQSQLGIKHPLYVYDPPPEHVHPQEEFPEEPVPFNEYLDKYRGRKGKEEEILRERLGRMGGLGGGLKDPQPPKYPNIDWYDDKHGLSSWHHSEKQKMNRAEGRYKGIFENKLD